MENKNEATTAESNMESTPETNTENAAENPAVETPTLSLEETLKAEVLAEREKYLRLFAEFDNYKKRTSKERVDLIKTAGQEVIVAMLSVLDDFERALKQMDNAQDVAAVKEGVNLVYYKFKNVLEQKGLKSMQSVDTEFNADLHEAITEIPAPTDAHKGKVVDEVEKGYFLFDKIIRFAKVVVGK